MSASNSCASNCTGRFANSVFLYLDLIWKPVGEKIRFVLVADGAERFILMGSDLNLSAEDMILAYSYRFKIEVIFKVLKHLIGAFLHRFWTRIGESDEQRTGNAPGSAQPALDRTGGQCSRGVRQLRLHRHRHSSDSGAELS